ncbi:protein kinase domain-containing protein [Sphingosinicella terrae]|uniref:protein kinase domain-containing protein n=1 Tax=Sphingosinicella terrae TaxID=2172047 RepID=UPI000E0CFC09|nr:winged helix-turn-helix domain-containing protein [Sphingosinicella terrae]
MADKTASRRRRRLWHFADAVFDEASWNLRVRGEPVALEGKPLELLHELLLRAGEVVTKDELLDAVWPGVTVVDGSLATAVSKLRKALGPHSETVIATVPRIGYRLASPVRIERNDAPLEPRFAFAAGEGVPGRAQWRLAEPLGGTGADDVWLARHIKTGEPRVFKFADTPARLRALKREAALARLLSAGLGKAAPLPALLEWNFEQSPYFVEYAYGGRDLVTWAAQAHGLDAIPLRERLQVAARIARAVEAVHGMGVLHKDLKPANILVDEGEGAEGPVVRLIDFGSGQLLDDALLDTFAITRIEPPAAEAGSHSRSGTVAYRAPELTGEAVPTVKSDVFALGLVLYQLAAGDFDRTLAPGWESGVEDPLLREDIAAAAALAPADRLPGAGALADRLEALERRRSEAAAEAERIARQAERRRLQERRAARRPWVRAAAASLVAGLVGTSSLAAYAIHQRNQAVEARRMSEASYGFLAEDVLASVDPARASAADETLVEVVGRAGAGIDRRFADQPVVAANLHATLARAFDLRSDYGAAFRHYEAAERAYSRAGAARTAPAIHARLQHAGALALSTRPGSLDRAAALLTAARQALAGGAERRPETEVWLASAEGTIALAGEDVTSARAAYGRAHAAADRLPERFTVRQRLNFGQRYAFTLLRLGEGVEAERTLRPLLIAMRRTMGPEHPDTLLLRLNLAQALLVQQRFPEVVRALDPLLPIMESRLGDAHRHTLLLLSVRQQALGSLGRYSEAAADGERVWRAASARDGGSSFTAVAARTDVGISHCRAGNLAGGTEHIRAALASLRTDLAGRMALEDAVEAALADCLIPMRRFDEAEALLRDIDREPVAQLVGDRHWGAQVDLALAEIALARGRPDAARTLLDRARGPLAANEDRYVRGRIAALGRALGTS